MAWMATRVAEAGWVIGGGSSDLARWKLKAKKKQPEREKGSSGVTFLVARLWGRDLLVTERVRVLGDPSWVVGMTRFSRERCKLA
ncbi:hypothetical protein CRG98_007609 [Punica granatum]|uniref:Uncharacterized protein n=1 Tax=Punica granatum TaxID=22663 RepID=A0A2I0KUH7_PUNGR|nr:hypothetical protein CRG98_007609 [Punica granatum]